VDCRVPGENFSPKGRLVSLNLIGCSLEHLKPVKTVKDILKERNKILLLFKFLLNQ